MKNDQECDANKKAGDHATPKPPVTPRLCLIDLGHRTILLPVCPRAKCKCHVLFSFRSYFPANHLSSCHFGTRFWEQNSVTYLKRSGEYQRLKFDRGRSSSLELGARQNCLCHVCVGKLRQPERCQWGFVFTLMTLELGLVPLPLYARNR